MKVALLAGSGRLPLEAAGKIKERGGELSVITFYEQAGMDFTPYTDDIATVSLGQVGKVIKLLKSKGIEEVVFAGKIDKSLLEKNLKLDTKAVMMLLKLKDRQEDTIMHAIVKEIEKHGIKVLSQLDVLQDLIIRKGVLGKVKPTGKQIRDVKFAYEKAKGLAGLDIGQTVIVKNKTVMAVESIEGTNATIERGASFSKDGFTFVKVAKPQQDYRFDIPVIGLETLEFFAKHNGAVFAVEAGYSLIIDVDECVEFANNNGFVLMAYEYE